MADHFKVIADPTRRAMIDLLRERERSASELAAPFAMSRAAASQHLALLLQAGFVDVRAVGRLRIYSLHPGALDSLRNWLNGAA